ncbi:hypothetical protein CKA32_001573 [Geitlerinema sp. FC II]|nr:hypothetical protein CKA32_001573 [Geitlerinema sp. FC II]
MSLAFARPDLFFGETGLVLGKRSGKTRTRSKIERIFNLF